MCWKYFTPGLMAFLVGYYYWTFQDNASQEFGENFPFAATLVGWCLAAVGIIQVPIMITYKVCTFDAPTWKKVKYQMKRKKINKINFLFLRKSSALSSHYQIGVQEMQTYLPNTIFTWENTCDNMIQF
jgi:hypothetical protein